MMPRVEPVFRFEPMTDVLDVSGSLATPLHAAQLCERLAGATDDHTRSATVDLQRVTSLSTYALAALVGAREATRASGARLDLRAHRGSAAHRELTARGIPLVTGAGTATLPARTPCPARSGSARPRPGGGDSGLRGLLDLAIEVVGSGMAAINLISDTHQHQVAAVGVEPANCLRSDSMCAATVAHGSPVVLADARRDERFHDNPFVDGRIAWVRFYAAFPMRVSTGQTIGTLCLFDERERELTEVQREALAMLAERVVDVIELRARSTEGGRWEHDPAMPLPATALVLHLLGRQLASVPAVADRTVEGTLAAAGSVAAQLEELLVDDEADAPELLGDAG
ncbi:GAF domain-containing protein [Nocardioides zeae]|uniref:GAF domain-containing protein n=1 Tax=Nocardioides imazamoxiresistens TaxID=3231893 RepID=A0ABU3PXY0_9ACTN|nr:GAF domain-containing protein [Nocardioides zeae]MDT9594100.1 GAF domain-containing protein [Nocardioides zeae]